MFDWLRRKPRTQRRNVWAHLTLDTVLQVEESSKGTFRFFKYEPGDVELEFESGDSEVVDHSFNCDDCRDRHMSASWQDVHFSEWNTAEAPSIERLQEALKHVVFKAWQFPGK
jgi:hypothetical protein